MPKHRLRYCDQSPESQALATCTILNALHFSQQHDIISYCILPYPISQLLLQMNLADSLREMGQQVQSYVKDIDFHDRKVQLAMVAAGITTVYVTRQAMKKRYNMPPGPYSWPIVGNLLCKSE